MFVIWNPVAAGGRGLRRWESLSRQLAGDGIKFDHAPTTHAGEAVELTARAIAAGHRTIGACGGDGTLHEVANAILNSGLDVCVAFFPTGSSCDFAKAVAHHPFPHRTRRRVDVIRVDSNDGTRYAVNYTSIGLMADATDRFNRREGVVGVARHFGVNAGAIAATAGALMALRPLDVTLTFDGASAT